MAKLDTTIDNLERKSNKVTGTIPSASWSDAQYPSAKTLYNAYTKLLDLMHPVGSILTTSTNTDPSATLGGTWELVDKGFKNNQLTLDSSYWSGTGATVESYSIFMLADHTISLRLSLTTNVALSDSGITSLGKLALDSCGITQLAHAAHQAIAISDQGDCTINYRIEQNGEIRVFDILNVDGTHNMAAGTMFYVNLVQPINHENMIDSFCDKFYWKRTA